MQPGDVIGGKYRLVRLIGDGGMGTVYEARHELLGTAAALKFLHPELARRPGLAQRFLQEARVSASIQSPHVTRVTDVDQTPEGAPYLVMELLTGESLQQLLDRRQRLPAGQALDFAVQIASGLEAAHDIGVVHRDLKPDNVYITSSSGGPLLKLLDFGIAKLKTGEYQKGLTRPGAVMGTPEYMAPEQLYSADRVDLRADIYSLGAILYEMLSGQRPANGHDAAAIISQVATGRVRRLEELDPHLPRALADVVHRALAPERERRYGSAAEFRAALLPFCAELSPAGRSAVQSSAGIMPVDAPTTVDEPVLQRGSQVPATLPPEDAARAAAMNAAAPKGSTVEAPKDLIRRITAASPGPAAYGPAPASPAAGPAYQAAPTGSYAGAPPVLRRRRTPWGAIVALLLGVLVTGAAIAVFALTGSSKEEPPSSIDFGTAAPATTISAQAPTATPPAQVDPEPAAPIPPSPAPPTPRAPRPSAPTTPTSPTKVDAGAGSADAGVTDAGAASPFPTLPIPLPLPSGFPTSFPTALPSSFPQIPGFPGQAPSGTAGGSQ